MTCIQLRNCAARFALVFAPFAAGAAGTLSVAPAGLSFGGQSMGTTSPVQVVTVTNTAGTGTLNVTGVGVASAQFTHSHNCAALSPGQSCRVDVAFRPIAASGALNSTAAVAGTLTISADGAGSPAVVNLDGVAEKSLITHYYRSILRRAPEADGKTYWANEATRISALGANVNETWFSMAQAFYFSPEYAAFNRDNGAFVTDLYKTFFNRAPDSGGLDYWTGQLAAGMPREVVLAGFMFSTEFGNFTQAIFGNVAARAEVNTVMDFYRGLLARLPDDGGFNAWIGRFRSAQCLNSAAVIAEVESISSAFALSPEFTARGRNNSQFVGDLYNAFLRRGGDLPGVQFWINQIATGARSREDVRIEFRKSPEFQQRVNTLVAQGCSGPSASAHPRLWLADVTTMSRLVAAAQANHPYWTALKSFCDTKAIPTYHYQGDEMYRYVANFSLCYRVVRATSGATAAATYAQKAVNLLQSNTYPVLNFTAYNTDAGYGIRNYVPTMALAYDWLADSPLMTATVKTAISNRIKAWMGFYAASGYGNSDFISNYNSGYMLARVMWAIAGYGEHVDYSSYWEAADAHFKGALVAFDTEMEGGHWPEGWNYGAGVNERYLMAASGLRTFTNDPKYVASNWLAGNVLVKMNSITPDGKYFIDDGAWTGSAVGVPDAIDAIVAGYTHGWSSQLGRISRSFVDLHLAGANQIVSEEWKVFLFYDTASQPADLSAVPKSYLASGMGVVTMRSDWTAAGGTWASLMSGGPYLAYQSSQDADQGHLEIYRRAPLLIDVSHDLYDTVGQEDTVFQNTFTMEGRVDGSYSGQRDNTLLCRNPLGTNPIGNRGYVDGGAYVFASGEFSAAYQIANVDPSVNPCARIPATWVARNLFFLRPGLFVLYDQIQKSPDQPNLVATMHMHFPTAPVATNANRQLTVDNGGGRLHFATVIPSNSTNTLQFRAKNTTTGPGVANHHLMVRYPTAGVANQNFLSVLRAGDATPTYGVPTTAAISGTSAFGVLIGGLASSEANGPVAVVFADNATRTVPISIQYSYTTAVPAYNYVAMLKPNTKYVRSSSIAGGVVTVTVTENASGAMTDAAGVLGFAQ